MAHRLFLTQTIVVYEQRSDLNQEKANCFDMKEPPLWLNMLFRTLVDRKRHPALKKLIYQQLSKGWQFQWKLIYQHKHWFMMLLLNKLCRKRMSAQEEFPPTSHFQLHLNKTSESAERSWIKWFWYRLHQEKTKRRKIRSKYLILKAFSMACTSSVAWWTGMLMEL